MYRFRYLDPADAERWPGWHEVDMGAYHDMDSGVVMMWEEATGYLVMDRDDGSPTNIAEAAKRRQMKAMVAIQWLAILLSGDRTPWTDFRPKALQIEIPAEALKELEEATAKAGNLKGPAKTRATRAAKSASAAATSPRPRARKAAAPRRSES